MRSKHVLLSLHFVLIFAGFATFSYAAESVLRVLDGKHITLHTDIASSSEIDALPGIFDAAVPIWCDYFGIESNSVSNWKITGVLVGDARNFAGTTLLKEVPQLKHGYTVGDKLWVRDQASDYYRRHLLLHEGVHALMYKHFGNKGPRWYMEGMAELLATHKYDAKSNTVLLPYFPEDRDSVPLWGRIKLVKEFTKKNEPLPIDAILKLRIDDADDTLSYAWSWAIAAFVNEHPLYIDILPKIAQDLSKPDFNEKFLAQIEQIETGRVTLDWHDYVKNIEYGYDFPRAAIDSAEQGKWLTNKTQEITVDTTRGWQNSGIAVEKGKTYTFTASGKFQVAKEPDTTLRSGKKLPGKEWHSEPNGVTLEYY
ncbi:MAG: hypothetical protein ACRC2T_07220, partial [Thermoguttaceae bacterium]